VDEHLAVQNHIAVRDTLRSEQALREVYGKVKFALGEQEWKDDGGEGYGKGQLDFMETVHKRVGSSVKKRKELQEAICRVLEAPLGGTSKCLVCKKLD